MHITFPLNSSMEGVQTTPQDDILFEDVEQSRSPSPMEYTTPEPEAIQNTSLGLECTMSDPEPAQVVSSETLLQTPRPRTIHIETTTPSAIPLPLAPADQPQDDSLNRFNPQPPPVPPPFPPDHPSIPGEFPATQLDAASHPAKRLNEAPSFPDDAGQPSKRLNQGVSSSDKCRVQEVDYSESLRKSVHEKDQHMNRLREKLRQRGQALRTSKQALSTSEQKYKALYDQVRVARKEFDKQNSDVKTLLQARQGEVIALHDALKVQAQEHDVLVTHIYWDKDLADKRHQEELEGLGRQLEDNMREQMRKILEASLQQRDHEMEVKTAEMGQRLQAELDAMKANKERELANMEQRYAHRVLAAAQPLSGIQHTADVNMDPGTEPLPSPEQTPTQPPSAMQTPTRQPPSATTTTPSLDTIRRIKKCRAGAVSRRTCLVGVSMEEEPAKMPHEAHKSGDADHGHGRPNTQSQSDVSSISEVIARAVETALHNALGNNNLLALNPSPVKRSPQRRRVEDQQVMLEKQTEPSHHRDFILGEIRRLFKDMFKITQDTDFIAHIPASADTVHAYQYEDGAGPDPNNLMFDLTCGAKSLWNSAILEIILHIFQKRSAEEKWLVTKSDNYIRVELKTRYKKLRTAWLRGQPKLTRNGVLETPAEVEARLIDQMTQLGKESRQATRRRNKYHRRVTVLDHIVKLKVECGDDDIDSWTWLHDLTKLLGEHGMSSEESAVENDVEHVLRVKQMEWRRCIDRELEIIDTERLIGNDIFSPQGARPVRRVRAPDNPTTSRKAVQGLPIDLYDSAWITGLMQCDLDALEIPSRRFIWRRIAVT